MAHFNDGAVATCCVSSECSDYVTVQVPLFANTELGFSRLLALSIKPVLFLKKDYIVRKGDIGNEVCAGFKHIEHACV